MMKRQSKNYNERLGRIFSWPHTRIISIQQVLHQPVFVLVANTW